MLRLYPSELEADFTQFYQLSAENIGTSLSLRRAGILAVQLPRESRTMRELDPSSEWGWTEYMLADIANSLRIARWQNTEDGHKGRNFPELIQAPGHKPKEPEVETYDVDEYRELLARPRIEITREEALDG